MGKDRRLEDSRQKTLRLGAPVFKLLEEIKDGRAEMKGSGDGVRNRKKEAACLFENRDASRDQKACWQTLRGAAGSRTVPGVSLRSTAGYPLSCLRHENHGNVVRRTKEETVRRSTHSLPCLRGEDQGTQRSERKRGGIAASSLCVV